MWQTGVLKFEENMVGDWTVSSLRDQLEASCINSRVFDSGSFWLVTAFGEKKVLQLLQCGNVGASLTDSSGGSPMLALATCNSCREWLSPKNLPSVQRSHQLSAMRHDVESIYSVEAASRYLIDLQFLHGGIGISVSNVGNVGKPM